MLFIFNHVHHSDISKREQRQLGTTAWRDSARPKPDQSHCTTLWRQVSTNLNIWQYFVYLVPWIISSTRSLSCVTCVTQSPCVSLFQPMIVSMSWIVWDDTLLSVCLTVLVCSPHLSVENRITAVDAPHTCLSDGHVHQFAVHHTPLVSGTRQHQHHKWQQHQHSFCLFLPKSATCSDCYQTLLLALQKWRTLWCFISTKRHRCSQKSTKIVRRTDICKDKD